MSGPTEIVAPLLNVNEPKAQVVSVAVREGDRVEPGAVICALETTKAAVEVTSPVAGYVRELRVRQGAGIGPEERICLVTPTPDEPVSERGSVAGAAGGGPGDDEVPDGLRITRAARALARELGVALRTLPRGPIITEREVRARAGPGAPVSAPAEVPGETRAPTGQVPGVATWAGRPRGAEPASPPSFDNRIIVYGGGGHGRSLLDLLARTPSLRVAGVVDDSIPPGQVVLGSRVLGPRAALTQLAAAGLRLAANGVGGLRDVAERIEAFATLESAGFVCPALVHTAAIVEGSATIHDGAQVFANAYVGSASVIGRGTIVNSSTVISHDCVIGDCAHIAPGAILAGAVHVGHRSLVGMGVLVALGVRIGSDARIGNGAIVNGDVPDGAVVPAGSLWPRRLAGAQDDAG